MNNTEDLFDKLRSLGVSARDFNSHYQSYDKLQEAGVFYEIMENATDIDGNNSLVIKFPQYNTYLKMTGYAGSYGSTAYSNSWEVVTPKQEIITRYE